MSEPFIAEIKIFAGNFAPRSYAFCNGQLLPIAQNTALFSLIGTIYGGDGRTTTALPNLQGRAPMHPGNGPGLSSRRIGERGGSTTETLSASQLPSHGHQLQGTDRDAQSGDPTGALYAASSETVYGTTGPSNPTQAGTGFTGGGQAHNNLQPYLAINFIIALQGLYPSRS